MASRSKPQVGKLDPKYKLIVNRYLDCRYSSCPICRKPTYARKFALFVHVGEGTERNGLVLGKTGKYCAKCELIIMHEREIQEQIAASGRFEVGRLEDIKFLVLGTIDLKIWRKSIAHPKTLKELFEHMADIKSYLDVSYQRPNWQIE